MPLTTLNNPTPGAQDRFGQCVAIAGTRVIVGAPGDDSVTIDGGSAYLYDVAGRRPEVPVATLAAAPVPGANSPFNGFGSSLGISGTRVIVGAPPSAYIYDFAGTTPVVPIATLYNPGADGFGYSVAISGPRSVVGAYTSRTPGSAYVYNLASSTPTVAVATLSATSGQGFGYSVAISGTRVAVGAPDAGRAYVYDLASLTPIEPPLELNNPGTARGFGWAVAIAGMRVVVDAFSWGQTNSGAYVYDFTSTPVRMITLSNASPAPGEVFGFSVAISGARVVVGTGPYPWDAGAPGKAYVYNLESDTPAVPVVTLLRPPGGYPVFGYSVAVSGPRVVVSSLHREFENAWGRTYVYDLDSDAPTLPIATLSNPMFAKDDYFGGSVAVDGTTVVVGSVHPPASGAAFVFGPRPRLTIAPASTNSATISWSPENTPEFFLQSADKLAPSNWVYAPSGTPNPVTILLTNQSRFYRLLSP